MKDGTAEVVAHQVLGRARCDSPACRLVFDELLEPDEPVRVRLTQGFLRRRPALVEGLAEALGRQRRVLPRQLELFEASAALDVDGAPVDLGQLVTLHPEGDLGVLVGITACHPVGGRAWHRVEVELEQGTINVRGSHQVRGA